MFHVYERGGASIIQVSQDLDLLSSGALTSAIALAVEAPSGPIVINLSDCNYCDSSGLNALLRAKVKLRERLIVVGPSRREGRRIFDLMQLTEALALCRTLDEALTIPPRCGNPDPSAGQLSA